MLVTLLLVFGVLVTGLVAVPLGAFGVSVMVSGIELETDAGVVTNPLVRLGGAALLAAALGNGLASAYMAFLLWQRYRDWRRWQALRPGRSYWDYAAEAEKERDRVRRSRKRR
jgi:uncharacterized membrane protein YdfJ with MMPL/SSD domain